MRELKFDENIAIREVLDDILGMVNRREKLIESASSLAEESRDELTIGNVKRLEGYMSDFLVLFEPVLVKVRSYGEQLHDSIRETENYLRSLVGIIDAGKSVEGTSATLQELEKDANGVEEELQLMHEAMDKIEDLFKKTSRYTERAQEEKAQAERSQAAREQAAARTRSNLRDFGSRPRFSTGQPTKSQY